MRNILVAVVALAGLSGVALAQGPSVEISAAWARATTSTARVGGAFMTLKAVGEADRVVSVSSPIAEKIELHETINDGGVMKMREVAQLVLAPGQPIVLKPGSYHIMLIGLKKPLNRGESFALTVTFEKAPPVTATVTVEAAGAASPGHQGH